MGRVARGGAKKAKSKTLGTISPDMLQLDQFTMTPNKKEKTFTRKKWLKWKENKTKTVKIWYTYEKVTQGSSSSSSSSNNTKIVPVNASSTSALVKEHAVTPAEKTSADIGNKGMYGSYHAVEAMFHRFDLDHNGSLDKSELMMATTNDEELASYVSPSRALMLRKQIFEPMDLEAFQTKKDHNIFMYIYGLKKMRLKLRIKYIKVTVPTQN
jgi:hypothetical protein